MEHASAKMDIPSIHKPNSAKFVLQIALIACLKIKISVLNAQRMLF